MVSKRVNIRNQPILKAPVFHYHAHIQRTLRAKDPFNRPRQLASTGHLGFPIKKYDDTLSAAIVQCSYSLPAGTNNDSWACVWLNVSFQHPQERVIAHRAELVK